MTPRRTLHHFPLDPASRQARLALGEKRLDFDEVVVRYWEPNPEFEALNPSGLTPVLVEETDRGQLVVCETRAILDHLEETAKGDALLSPSPAERAEARRLLQWFDKKFDYEVNALLLHEKMEKRLLRLGPPDMPAMRAGREALRRHLGYFDELLQARDWLAGRRLSLADIAAAAHLSVLDYFGEVPWRDYPALKTWYSRIKSRPCFRPLLADRQPGIPPAEHYDDLDF
ncbi:glutathione S-transferase family protein [Caulobacter sp. 17J80-11]|uniref:FtsZ-binding protein FzlA n=1 Tax=Caulobacter sp. 17J80-11 TaxID=2763502 RepID=UPI001653874D|nr:glutathione S-transferase family protein [Caulobacter sp. 17J80-11]MBC6983615.1 glutathione S-transferase family protein [Caulobacter sp. 17J80-11]